MFPFSLLLRIDFGLKSQADEEFAEEQENIYAEELWPGRGCCCRPGFKIKRSKQ